MKRAEKERRPNICRAQPNPDAHHKATPVSIEENLRGKSHLDDFQFKTGSMINITQQNPTRGLHCAWKTLFYNHQESLFAPSKLRKMRTLSQFWMNNKRRVFMRQSLQVYKLVGPNIRCINSSDRPILIFFITDTDYLHVYVTDNRYLFTVIK